MPSLLASCPSENILSPPVLQPKTSHPDEKLLATVCINGTFIAVLEAPSCSACNNCPFALSDPMPHTRPVCCIPDYLACRPHIRFRIAELKKGVSA